MLGARGQQNPGRLGGDAAAAQPVAAGLSVFRIANDGKLTFQRKYDIETGDRSIFWSGVIAVS